jgi:hypothetical protein
MKRLWIALALVASVAPAEFAGTQTDITGVSADRGSYRVHVYK